MTKKRCMAIAATALMLVGWICFIFRNTLKSMPLSAEQCAYLSGLVARLRTFIGIDATKSAVIFVRKSAHIFEFFVLALLLFLLLRLIFTEKPQRFAYSITAVFSVIAATTDEILQIFSNRGPAVKDVLIDCIGIVLALLLCFLVQQNVANPHIKHTSG